MKRGNYPLSRVPDSRHCPTSDLTWQTDSPPFFFQIPITGGTFLYVRRQKGTYSGFIRWDIHEGAKRL
jgi:hypothetical protein